MPQARNSIVYYMFNNKTRMMTPPNPAIQLEPDVLRDASCTSRYGPPNMSAFGDSGPGPFDVSAF